MKRFKFTLQAVYDVAVSTEKQQKAHLKRLTERLEQLRGDLTRAQNALQGSRSECAEEMKKGMGSDKLAQYSRYFESMVSVIGVLVEEIAKTNDEREKWVAEYIKTRNKIKALDKMREIQMEEYQIELKKEQDAEIGDILSFRVAVR